MWLVCCGVQCGCKYCWVFVVWWRGDLQQFFGNKFIDILYLYFWFFFVEDFCFLVGAGGSYSCVYGLVVCGW